MKAARWGQAALLRGMDDTGVQLQTVEPLRLGVERRLAELSPPEGAEPQGLTAAARYALLAPGKRFRPMLTLLAARDFGAPEGAAMDVGCALEMVHAASLILDDLPSMDDAAMRRGRPTTHKAYGEAVAILAAVGLLNRAFGVIAAESRLPAAVRADLVAGLSATVGFDGLVAGQARDIAHREQVRAIDAIDLLNHQKTGVLIMAAAQSGALIAGAPASRLKGVAEFARRVGLAFQIRDDLLDAEGGDLDKDAGKDAGMTTLVSALGPRGARAAMREHLDIADAALADAGCQDGLMSQYVRGLFFARAVAA